MYQKFLKKVNSDQNNLKCLDLQDNNFEVLRLEIALDKINIEYVDTVKPKLTGNESDFITYSNTINFDSKWLGKSVYILTQSQKLGKEQAIKWLKKLGRTKTAIKVGKISGKYDIFTVEKQQIVLIVN